MVKLLVCFIAVLQQLASTGSTADERQQAQLLWEQAITAKGGRDRLASISSIAILEKAVFKPATLPEMATGRTWQTVCALPNSCWEFVDYRPGRMGYSVKVVNTETGLGWSSFGAPAKPFLRPDTNAAYRVRQLQYAYFLETRWVRPIPLRTARIAIESKQADRLETQVDEERVVYYLDVATHLPFRIETSREIVLKPPRPGMKPPGAQRHAFDLDRYQEVAGVLVFTRMSRGGAAEDVRVEINPLYDPSIFTKPPSPGATIDSWRKGSNQL